MRARSGDHEGDLCLVTVLHDQTGSFCHAVAHRAAYEMAARGWTVALTGPGDPPAPVGAADTLVVVLDDAHADAPTPRGRRARHRLVIHVSEHGSATRPARDASGVLRIRFGPLAGSTSEIRTAWLEELDGLFAPVPENRAG